MYINKNKIIFIENLCIELTQRCNLKCDHCLKGNSCDVDINEQNLDAIFDNEKEFFELTETINQEYLEGKPFEKVLKRN